MSHLIFFGSGSTSIKLDSGRGPSASCTMASTYGTGTLNALLNAWCPISNECSVPRPLDCTQPMSRAWHFGQATRGYQNTWPQALHLGSISFCSRRPSQYGLASGVIGLGSGRSISMEALLVVGGQRLDGGPETVKRWQNVHGVPAIASNGCQAR